MATSTLTRLTMAMHRMSASAAIRAALTCWNTSNSPVSAWKNVACLAMSATGLPTVSSTECRSVPNSAATRACDASGARRPSTCQWGRPSWRQSALASSGAWSDSGIQTLGASAGTPVPAKPCGVMPMMVSRVPRRSMVRPMMFGSPASCVVQKV